MSKNFIKHVFFEPDYVGWGGLPFAIQDAGGLGVPLMVNDRDLSRVQEYVAANTLNIEVITK